MRAQIVEVQARFLCLALDEKPYFVARVALQETPPQIQYLVELARQMETKSLAVFGLKRVCRRHFLVGEPAFCGKREFEFVAVETVVVATYDRKGFGQFHLAYRDFVIKCSECKDEDNGTIANAIFCDL